MPGLPLLNLGTALGGLVRGYDQQQENAQQRQLNALLQQLRQNQLQQVVREQKARQMLGALAGTPEAASLFGAGGGQSPQPPMPGQASQPQPPQMGQGGMSTLPPPSPFVGWNGGNTAPAGSTGFVPGTWPTRYGMSSSNDYGRGGAGDPGGDINPDDGGFSSPRERRDWYMQEAAKRGLSQPTLDRLVSSEGGWSTFDRSGDSGTSFGPLQMHVAGKAPGTTVPGLGDDFRRQTGLDPSNPANEKPLALFALDYAQKSGGFSSDIWHGLRRGGGGGAGSPSGSMPRLAPPIYRPPPQGYDLNNLATQLRKTNPGIDPETMFSALDQYQHLMDGPSKDAWERFKFETQEQRHDYEFQAGEQDKALERQLSERRADITEKRQAQQDTLANQRLDLQLKADEERGWSIQTLPDGSFVRVNPGKNVIEPFKLPAGATKQGTAAQAASTISPQLESGIVDAIGTYRAPPPSMSGWSGQRAQHIMAQVMQKYPDYDATQYNAKNRGAAATGLRSGQLATQAAVAEEEISLTLETSEKIDRTAYPTINSMLIAVEKGTGDENVVRFLDQLNALKIVYASALNRSGVNTVDSMKRFDDILNAAWSKGQIRAALDQFQKTLAAERRGIDRAMGRRVVPPEAGVAPSGSGGGGAAPVIKLDENGNVIQ